MRRLAAVFIAFSGAYACSGVVGEQLTRLPASNGDSIVIASPLALDLASVQAGQTQTGHVTYRNTTSSVQTIDRIVIAMRRPGATHAGGPYDDASPQAGPLMVQPGAQVALDASRQFGSADPSGNWESYATFQDGQGVWHDGPSVFFVVGSHSLADAGCGTPHHDGGTTAPDGGGGGPDGSGGPPPSSGYFHTSGADIVDAKGNVVRLTGLSWFGLETPDYSLGGLWARPMGDMLDQMKSLGYNIVRIPYSSQLFDGGKMPTNIDYSKNPTLMGLDGPAILDRVIQEAGKRGLRVILDRHRPDAGAQSALWYTPQYSEQRWIQDWQNLTTKYKGNTTVIGMDLHNEPHDNASWGDGNMATDWRLAAERAGNAILAINPDLLIIVEGVQNVGGDYYWWGGNLMAAGSAPVRLNVANRVVYSPHDYPSTISPQTWFNDPNYPNNLPGVWDKHWGYLVQQKIAPVWVGEFGTKNVTPSDQQWFTSIASYIGANRISFAYWCWNPNSGDTGGIVDDATWSIVHQDKQTIIQPILAPAL